MRNSVGARAIAMVRLVPDHAFSALFDFMLKKLTNMQFCINHLSTLLQYVHTCKRAREMGKGESTTLTPLISPSLFCWNL